MATAKFLEYYEDPGMAFTDEEVEGFSIDRVAEARLLWLIEIQNILYCYWRLCDMGNLGARVWAEKAHKDLETLAGYHCVAAGLDAPDSSDFYRFDKDFIVAAQMIEYVEDWVREIMAQTVGLLRREVTLADRAMKVNKWKKGDRSRANKYFNAVVNQRKLMDKWVDDLKKYGLRRPENDS
jgi:hypothetical protein